jgi:hypothetical protein
MLGDKSDIFYGARLVADARLHLGSVINGGKSEIFFVTMWKIIDNNVYLGYKTFSNKDVTLGGIKDFIFNYHYGLGIKKITLSSFLANCAKAATKDKTQAQCAARFARWLGEQHEGFDFPPEFFEYMRIKYYIKKLRRVSTKDRYRKLFLLDKIYNEQPHALEHIGAGRKYKDVFDCAEDLQMWQRAERLKPLSLYSHPTIQQVSDLAENLSVRLDSYKRRILIAKLIEIYKRDQEEKVEELDDDA